MVSDFGIALAVSAGGGDRLTETGLSLGTPHYMSPEQATGDLTVGPTADIHALGCVLYEMLVGEPPYAGSTPQSVLGKIIAADVRSLSEQRASVPPNVEATVFKALEKVSADRFMTGGEFARALADLTYRDRSSQHELDAVPGHWKGIARCSRRWIRIDPSDPVAARPDLARAGLPRCDRLSALIDAPPRALSPLLRRAS